MISKAYLKSKGRYGITGIHNCVIFQDYTRAQLDGISENHLIEMIQGRRELPTLWPRQPVVSHSSNRYCQVANMNA